MVPGLLKPHYDHLLAVARGEVDNAPLNVVRHCELKGWVRSSRLTEDGLFVLERAAADPPPPSWRHLVG